jgi:tight adherence protein B
MTGIRRAVAVALATLLTILLAATPAAGEPSGSISHLEQRDGSVQVVFSARGLSADGTLDPATVTMTVEGRPVRTTARPLGSSRERRSVVLAIDTSDSLRAEGLAAAKAAAREYLRRAPDDVLIGLVTFASTVSVEVAPTTERAPVSAAIGRLRLSTGTRLYDAVDQSVAVLGSEGVRAILLVTDGSDVGSRTTLQDALRRVKSSKVSADVIAVGSDVPGGRGPLEALAERGGGKVVEAPDAADLTQRLADAARTLQTQVLVTGELPADAGAGPAAVVVAGMADGVRVRDTSVISLPDRPPAPPVSTAGAPLIGRSVLAVALVGLFLALAAILGVAALAVGDRAGTHSTFRRRLSIYTLSGRAAAAGPETATALGTSAVARGAIGLAARVIARRDLERRLAASLDAAGLPLRAAEWLLLHVAVATAAGFVGLLVGRGSLVLALWLLAVGAIGPFVLLTYRQAQRSRAMLAQLPDVLQLMAGSLAAGYSLPQALDAVVREGQEPIASEFSRALLEARLGVSAEDALSGVAARMRSQDLAWVVMAIRIQREVGGNLAELLRSVAETLRERDFLRRHVRALSAEGRLSAWILGCLPPVIAVGLLVLRPEYVRPLFTETLGITLVAIGLVLLGLGVFWMSRIVKVEV